ncbi:MAG: FeoA family protein [Thermofilaceae archaeon]
MIRSLADVPAGSKVLVVEVTGGLGAKKRLLEMGLSPGSEVEVLINGFSGPVVVKVRGVTAALGRGLAVKVLVKPREENEKEVQYSE